MNISNSLSVNEPILNLFFTEKDNRIPAPDSNGSMPTSFDCLESILNLVESALIAENGDIVFTTLP